MRPERGVDDVPGRDEVPLRGGGHQDPRADDIRQSGAGSRERALQRLDAPCRLSGGVPGGGGRPLVLQRAGSGQEDQARGSGGGGGVRVGGVGEEGSTEQADDRRQETILSSGENDEGRVRTDGAFIEGE